LSDFIHPTTTTRTETIMSNKHHRKRQDNGHHAIKNNAPSSNTATPPMSEGLQIFVNKTNSLQMTKIMGDKSDQEGCEDKSSTYPKGFENVNIESKAHHNHEIIKTIQVNIRGSLLDFSKEEGLTQCVPQSKWPTESGGKNQQKLILKSSTVKMIRNTSCFPVAIHIEGIPINCENLTESSIPSAFVVPPHIDNLLPVKVPLYVRRKDFEKNYLQQWATFDEKQIEAEILKKEEDGSVWILAHSEKSPSHIFAYALSKGWAQTQIKCYCLTEHYVESKRTMVAAVAIEAKIAERSFREIKRGLIQMPFTDLNKLKITAMRDDGKPWHELRKHKEAHLIETTLTQEVHITASIENTYIVYNPTDNAGGCGNDNYRGRGPMITSINQQSSYTNETLTYGEDSSSLSSSESSESDSE
jgi:hypothetical protein